MSQHVEKNWHWAFLQAMYANTSISTGMKGASKAMAAMNKVWWKFTVNILGAYFNNGKSISQMLSHLHAYILICDLHVSANGTSEAVESDERIPEAIITNGYDGNTLIHNFNHFDRFFNST